MASSKISDSKIDPKLVLSHKFAEVELTYCERDVAIYALGVGACNADAVDTKELHYVYHRNGQPLIKVLPTFVSLFPLKNSNRVGFVDMPGLHYDPTLLLHGQQYIELYRPIPSGSTIVNKASIAALHDKGKAAIVELETTSYLKETGEILCMNRSTVFLRGAGGFSDSSKLHSYSTYPPNQIFRYSIPKSEPRAIYEDCTQNSQALLYRLSGDYNPLHSDPSIAENAGFARPILHGLCTLGFAIRAVVKSFCNSEPAAVKCIFGRFLLHVYPGETLVTEMWLQAPRYINLLFCCSLLFEGDTDPLSLFIHIDTLRSIIGFSEKKKTKAYHSYHFAGHTSAFLYLQKKDLQYLYDLQESPMIFSFCIMKSHNFYQFAENELSIPLIVNLISSL